MKPILHRKPMSAETKKKISETHKAIGVGKWMAGKKSSAAAIEKYKQRVRENGHGFNFKHGLSGDPKFLSWAKNKRNRLLRSVEGSHTYDEWFAVLLKFDHCCAHCRKPASEVKLEQDHIIPVSKGGTDFISNIQPLCRKCNAKKYNKIPT